MTLRNIRPLPGQWRCVVRLLGACLIPPAIGFNFIIRGPLWTLQGGQVLLLFPLLCALIGLAVGVAQLLLLPPPRPWWRWISATSLAWMAAAWLMFSGMAILGSLLDVPAEAWLVPVMLVGAFVGWVQTRARQQTGRWYKWWVPVTAVSWGVLNFLLVRIYLGSSSW